MGAIDPVANDNATRGEADTLLDWMTRQCQFSAATMLPAISATELVKQPPDLGQTIRPAPGSILASPEIASYDSNQTIFSIGWAIRRS